MLRTISCFADAIWSSERHRALWGKRNNLARHEAFDMSTRCSDAGQPFGGCFSNTSYFSSWEGGDKCAWYFLVSQVVRLKSLNIIDYKLQIAIIRSLLDDGHGSISSLALAGVLLSGLSWLRHQLLLALFGRERPHWVCHEGDGPAQDQQQGYSGGAREDRIAILWADARSSHRLLHIEGTEGPGRWEVATAGVRHHREGGHRHGHRTQDARAVAQQTSQENSQEASTSHTDACLKRLPEIKM